MTKKTIDYKNYADEQLTVRGFKTVPLTEKFVTERIEDIMEFVNSIRNEYGDLYGWKEEPKEYFLNPLNDKFKYSFAILNRKNEFCFMNFSSVYDGVIHYHFGYARKDSRGLNLAKLHIIKFCQICLEDSFTQFEGYFPKNNNSSIILYLKMGWQIESLRNNKELFMTADIKYVRDHTYELVNSVK